MAGAASVTRHRKSGHGNSENLGMIDLARKDHALRKCRFTQEQIASVVKQAELGAKVEEIFRKMKISDAIFYKWRQEYCGPVPSDLPDLQNLHQKAHVHPRTRICEAASGKPTHGFATIPPWTR